MSTAPHWMGTLSKTTGEKSAVSQRRFVQMQQAVTELSALVHQLRVDSGKLDRVTRQRAIWTLDRIIQTAWNAQYVLLREAGCCCDNKAKQAAVKFRAKRKRAVSEMVATGRVG